VRKIVLDTNGCVALLAGDDAVLDELAAADRILMSVVVLGELHAGFKGGNKERDNVELLDEFLRRPAVLILDATRAKAEVFGVVKNLLKQAGTPIPINDVWIAAHAIETGSWVVTLDRRFALVPGLLLWEGLAGA
jgi:tRNA(fMet)-specific endonuclease VapC